MFSPLKRRLHISIMGLMGRCHIHGIYILIKGFCITVRLYLPLLRKVFSAFPVRIIYGLRTHAAHKFRLRHKTVGNPAGSDNADALNMLTLLPEHRTGDILCPFQINYIAVITDIVKDSHPVRTDREDIDMVLLNVTNLLSQCLFNDNFIHKSSFSHIFHTDRKRIYDVELSSLHIVFFCRHADDQIVAQCLRPLKQTVMPLMEKVESSICNYLCHDFFPFTNSYTLLPHVPFVLAFIFANAFNCLSLSN